MPGGDDVPDDELLADVLALGAVSRAAREVEDPELKDLAEHAAGKIVDKYKTD